MTLMVPLTDEEMAIVVEIRRQGAFTSDADVVRASLWRYAEHFEIDVPADAFAIGLQPDLFEAPPS